VEARVSYTLKMFFRKYGIHPQDYTVPQPRRPQYEFLLVHRFGAKEYRMEELVATNIEDGN
jgi:hypothetical protein